MRRPLPPLVNRYSGVVDAEAMCADCDFDASNPKNALAMASQHARRTGHQVRAGQTISVTYNQREGVSNRYDWADQ